MSFNTDFKTVYAPARAHLRSIRDGAAASLADTDPLASELLARAAVVLGRLNGRPTLSVFPPAEGLTIHEGNAPCDFPADSVEDTSDADIASQMMEWARSAVERGVVEPLGEASPTGNSRQSLKRGRSGHYSGRPTPRTTRRRL